MYLIQCSWELRKLYFLDVQVNLEHHVESVSQPSSNSLRGLLDVILETKGQPVSMPGQPTCSEPTSGKKKKMRPWRRKEMVIESINEYYREIEGIPSQIANQSLDHIHAHEVGCAHKFVYGEKLYLCDDNNPANRIEEVSHC